MSQTALAVEIMRLIGSRSGVALRQVADLLGDHKRDEVHGEIRRLLHAGQLVLTAGWQLVPPTKSDTHDSQARP